MPHRFLVLAAAFLGEPLSLPKVAGIALVIAGVVVRNRAAHIEHRPRSPLR